MRYFVQYSVVICNFQHYIQQQIEVYLLSEIASSSRPFFLRQTVKVKICASKFLAVILLRLCQKLVVDSLSMNQLTMAINI